MYSSIVLLEHWITCAPQSACVGARAPGPLRHAPGHAAQHVDRRHGKLVNGESPMVEAALVKDLGTEFEQSIPAVIEAAIAMDRTATRRLPSCTARWLT
jgi:hypothetical protein